MSIRQNTQVVAFVEAARAYCGLIETEPVVRQRWIREIHAALARVYANAQVLPEATIDGTELDIPDSLELTNEEWSALFKRLQGLFGKDDLYWFYFWVTDAANENETPDARSISDDLADIYRTLRDGLRAWDTGEDGFLPSILFEWEQEFQDHAGRHATGALAALREINYHGGGVGCYYSDATPAGVDGFGVQACEGHVGKR